MPKCESYMATENKTQSISAIPNLGPHLVRGRGSTNIQKMLMHDIYFHVVYDGQREESKGKPINMNA